MIQYCHIVIRILWERARKGEKKIRVLEIKIVGFYFYNSSFVLEKIKKDII